MILQPIKENPQLNKNIIAENILSLMKHKNITETRLAEELGISVMTVRRVVLGETSDPRISTLKLFADYFEVSLNAIIEKKIDWKEMSFKNKPYFIPVLDWDAPIQLFKNKQTVDLSSWKEWYPLVNNQSIQLNNSVFALKAKASMQPRYPEGTILIINPQVQSIDGDVILIISKQKQEVSLRQLIIDIPRWILKPIIGDAEVLFFDETQYEIIGVVVLSLFQRN